MDNIRTECVGIGTVLWLQETSTLPDFTATPPQQLNLGSKAGDSFSLNAEWEISGVRTLGRFRRNPPQNVLRNEGQDLLS